MFAMPSSTVRKEWSDVMDSVVRRRPAFIRRTRDYMMLCSTDTIADLVSALKFQVEQFTEADGSVTLSMKALDLISAGDNLPEAKKALVQDIKEYAEEYYQEFELYSRAPNRKSHLPYVMKALTAKSDQELEDAIECQNGKN